MEPVIVINDLTKNYGEIKAINGITFSVHKGEMFGLVGPDGAGKTSTIRTLCGLTSGSSGTSTLYGFDTHKDRKEVQKRIGYLSQKFSLYGDLTVDENIEFFAEINGVRDYKERRNELLEFTRLIEFRKRPADKLSGGMKQKLALACSLIHRPQLLFLDEPTIGVDPVSRRDFWKILSNLLKDGITIFLTTPYLDEAERCTRVALMNKGKIIKIDTPLKLKEELGLDLIEIVPDKIIEANKVLISSPKKYETQLFGDRLNILTKDSENEIVKITELLKQNNINISSYRITLPSLENVFIHYVKEDYN